MSYHWLRMGERIGKVEWARKLCADFDEELHLLGRELEAAMIARDEKAAVQLRGQIQYIESRRSIATEQLVAAEASEDVRVKEEAERKRRLQQQAMEEKQAREERKRRREESPTPSEEEQDARAAKRHFEQEERRKQRARYDREF